MSARRDDVRQARIEVMVAVVMLMKVDDGEDQRGGAEDLDAAGPFVFPRGVVMVVFSCVVFAHSGLDHRGCHYTMSTCFYRAKAPAPRPQTAVAAVFISQPSVRL